LDKNELIGMQSHRLLAQGRPVLENSITPPIVIEKGQKVEILYSDGAMTLTAPGKALDQAYKGKQIKVVNLISNKTLTVIAQNEDIVEISN
jgi:flagella basal body P-ring formation protein FlgA